MKVRPNICDKYQVIILSCVMRFPVLTRFQGIVMIAKLKYCNPGVDVLNESTFLFLLTLYGQTKTTCCQFSQTMVFVMTRLPAPRRKNVT